MHTESLCMLDTMDTQLNNVLVSQEKLHKQDKTDCL